MGILSFSLGFSSNFAVFSPGNNPLLRTIFEVDAPAENGNVGKIHEEQSLWRFRSHICLEHLAHAFNENLAQKKGGGKDEKKSRTFPILQLFLKHVI